MLCVSSPWKYVPACASVEIYIFQLARDNMFLLPVVWSSVCVDQLQCACAMLVLGVALYARVPSVQCICIWIELCCL